MAYIGLFNISPMELHSKIYVLFPFLFCFVLALTMELGLVLVLELDTLYNRMHFHRGT